MKYLQPLASSLSPTKRFVRELNSIFVRTKNACYRNTYKPSVIADGIEPRAPTRSVGRSCVSCRRLSRWTTRSI